MARNNEQGDDQGESDEGHDGVEYIDTNDEKNVGKQKGEIS